MSSKSANFSLLKFGVGGFGVFETPSQYGLGLLGVSHYGYIPPDFFPSVQFMPGWLIYGRLGFPTDADPLNVRGIWQRRHTKTGIRSVKMKFYTPTNPQTELQQANRQKFADAMAAWGSLTSDEKAAYNKLAKRQSLLGRNLFVRYYYEANP